MWNINFLVILLSLVLHCQCASKEVVKFGTTNGTVLDLTNATKIDASNIEECISKCEEKELCVLASQMNSTCYLHLYGYNIIINKTTGEEGQVAFKLRTDQPACGANLPLLLNTKTYYLFANHSEEHVYVIETSKDHYTVKFEKIPLVEIDTGDCVDKNDGKEVVKFVIVNATTHGAQIFNRTTVKDFKECIALCGKSEFCMAASFTIQDGYEPAPVLEDQCYLHMHGSNIIPYKTQNRNEGQIAFKLRTSEPVCGPKFAETMDGTYFLHADHQAAYNYTIQTREKWYRLISKPAQQPVGSLPTDKCERYTKPGLPYLGGSNARDVYMVEVAAILGARSHIRGQGPGNNAEECQDGCLADNKCGVASWHNENKMCYLYNYNEIPLFYKSLSYANRISVFIKLPMGKFNCALEPYEMFSDYTMPIRKNRNTPDAGWADAPGDPKFFTIRQDSLHFGLTFVDPNYQDCYHQFRFQDGSCVNNLYTGFQMNQTNAERACAVRGAMLASPWYANAAARPDAYWPTPNVQFEWDSFEAWTSIKLKPECYNYTGKPECDGDKKFTSLDIQFAQPGRIAAAWGPGEPRLDGIAPEMVCAIRKGLNITGKTYIKSCWHILEHLQGLVCVTEKIPKQPDWSTVSGNFWG